MYLFAKFLSFITNPGFIILLTPLLIVYKVTGDPLYALKWELFSLLFVAIGAGFIFYGAWKGFFSDFDVSNKIERRTLYYFMIGINYVYLLFLFIFHAPRSLIIATLSVSIGIIVMGIANRFIKASIHVATQTAFFISLSLWYSNVFWAGILLVLLVAWSRVKIKRHTVSEVIAGGIIGSLITFTTYFVVKYVI